MLTQKTIWHFTLVSFIIGFMLAVQFQTNNEPNVRDTRDIWEIRQDLKKEQELHEQLLTEIRKYEETIEKYEQQRAESKGTVLRQTLEELKKEAGLTEVVGEGVVLYIEQMYDESYVGPIHDTVSADLLRRLINELNMYGAEQMSIAGQRIVNTTVIRDINGVTKVDTYPLRSFPIEVKVIATNAEKLYNRLKASMIVDNFALENLLLTISEPQKRVVIPPYDGTVRVKQMEAVEDGRR
ncbi:Uncharacterized conserved protein YlxW, UPF0749 family [Anoxybacillus pushchinoensis]|jgi:uncharacterized protein YlxW (UPF0749 family)|uniref:Uncharacterized conserved protein YlxW, UPF0749 family n=1 Tax=Anoxybacillus pushchinoensis TaxID=150248 RepID=A0A1I0TNT8_9BACL|nr:DUF881 domain-containing protein [Anoxybacillus pushchinoensis]SFA53442.1 Uncharacterized conserved protein YlxW, UPF0749 family [Anoxybacillus pushchinoensis]